MVKKKEYTGKKKVVSVGIKEELLVVAKAQAKKERRNFSNFIAVSYTHLTLPTSDLV